MPKTPPVVFAVAREYQIMVPVQSECVMWVQVGDETYYDDSNGILRSSRPIHRVSVPCEALNRAGRYTICTRKIVERKPYYPILEDEVRASFDFIPVPENRSPRFFVVADAHNHAEPAIAAARAYGEIDFLILNGDIPNHSGDIANFDIIYQIAGEITEGRIPVVFARGNHDLRGVHAEDLADYTPSDEGRTYFTFRLGDVWGIVLDCGEDKLDSQVEYGGTICCHAFRLRETAFLRRVIANAKDEYEAPGVRLRLVVAHNPFSQLLEALYQPTRLAVRSARPALSDDRLLRGQRRPFHLLRRSRGRLRNRAGILCEWRRLPCGHGLRSARGAFPIKLKHPTIKRREPYESASPPGISPPAVCSSRLDEPERHLAV